MSMETRQMSMDARLKFMEDAYYGQRHDGAGPSGGEGPMEP